MDKMLPSEILSDIFQYLSRPEIFKICHVCRNWNSVAIPQLYASIELVDEHEEIEKQSERSKTGKITISVHGVTKMRQLLKSFELNPEYAQYVTKITHRCYEKPPDPFAAFSDGDIRHLSYDDQLRSCAQTLKPIIEKMVNVRALYIIWGHDPIVKQLLRLLVISKRLERLWVESAYLPSIQRTLVSLLPEIGLSDMKSIRLRRMQCISIKEATEGVGDQVEDEQSDEDDDDDDNESDNSSDWIDDEDNGEVLPQEIPEVEEEEDDDDNEEDDDDDDDDDDDEAEEVQHAGYGGELMLTDLESHEEIEAAENVEERLRTLELANGGQLSTEDPLACFHLLRLCPHLTNLVLDWILPPHIKDFIPRLLTEDLTFPHLRAFQLRHPYMNSDHIKMHVSITHPLVTSFLLRHPNIVSFGWPAEWFADRLDHNADWNAFLPVLENMSSRLEFFRTDVPINPYGEIEFTNLDTATSKAKLRYQSRHRALRMVSELQNIETLKIEGSIPRDEAAAMVAATKSSKVKKIVFIGINWPFELLKPMAENQLANIEELKFCGFSKALLISGEEMWKPLVDHPYLDMIAETEKQFNILINHLSSFRRLKTLTISLNLPTSTNIHKDYLIDPTVHATEFLSPQMITSYWKTCQGMTQDEIFKAPSAKLQTTLEQCYTPRRLAQTCLDLFEKNLGKTFEMLRVLFLMEKEKSGIEIYDFEIETEWSDRHCSIKSVTGPRPESHPTRSQEKLGRRKYF